MVLSNGRYAYKVECPWKGKNGKDLTAFKFCGAAAYERYRKRLEGSKSEHSESEHED